MSEENSELAGQETAVTETPVHTPEAVAEAPEAAAENVEAPATEESAESVQTPEEAEAEAVPVEESAPDDIDLEPNRPLKTEEVDKLRIPAADKERIKTALLETEALKTQVDEVGGEFGVKTFAPFAKAITKASATDDELSEISNALVAANGAVTMQLLTGGAQFILSNNQLADPLLTSLFGDNATLENIKSLLTFDKAGLIDRDYSKAMLGEGFQDTDLYQQQVNEKAELQRELAELRAAIKDPAKLQELQQGTVGLNGRGDRAAKALESDFYAETPAKLKPLFEKLHWGESALSELVTELLQRRLKDDPSYKETEKYLLATGVYMDGDSRVGMASANLTILKNKFETQGREMIRKLQNAIRQASENSRNAKLAEQKKVAEAPKAAPQGQPALMPPVQMTAEQRQAEIDAKYKARLAAITKAEAASAV